MGPILCTRESELKLTLVTSIYPGNAAPQMRAIASWLAVPGIEVISLNSAVELPLLQREGYDPSVRFVEAHRDGREIVGKPVIQIYDAIAAGLASDAAMIGVINSDVMLRVSAKFVGRLWPRVEGGMVFGSRMDIPEADARAGQVYYWGFDYFSWIEKSWDASKMSPSSLACPGGTTGCRSPS